jgi:6-phosphogluconolactonase (cycloisomerase 2 family)
MSILRFRNLMGVSSIAILGVSSAAFVACSGDDTLGTTPTDAGGGSDVQVGSDTSTSDSSPPSDSGPSTASNVVYVESNDITPNGNSILAYSRGSDGSLTPLTGSPFMTGGTGIGNPTQGLGPDDSDQELIANAAHTLLFAVNAGSNTIAVFHIASDGSLTPVTGSPFASGGIGPVSVGVAGNFLYVVNQDGDPAQDAAAGAPSYTAFTIGADGSLTPIAGSTVSAGASPSVALVSPDSKILFGADFLAPVLSGAGPLRAFAIGSDGKLTNAPNTPMAIPYVDGGSPPGTPVALGLAVHPTQKILYVDFTKRSQVGVYTYDDTSGALTYVTETSVTGPAPCWARVNSAGNRIYVVTTGDDSLSVLDATNPMAPSEVQHFQLADTGGLLDDSGSGATESESFEESLSADEKYLYVLSQRSTTNAADANGNVLHVLTVGTDGHVTETVPDVKISVSLGSRPQGIVAF